MELRNLIETHLDLPRLSKDLDECGHFARVWSTNRWSRADQARLFEAAKGFRPLTLEDFVPASVPARVEVVHHGKNTLPAGLSHFEKHFFKPGREGAAGVLVGRNFQAMSPLTGPGYFVARSSSEAGEVEFDYDVVPAETLDAWGPIRSNAGGISAFVYRGMFDVMRGLSSQVSVGRVRKKGHFLDNWFVLVREGPREASAEAA